MKFIKRFYATHKKEIFLFLLMLVLELALIFALSQINSLKIFFRSDANEFQNIVRNLTQYRVFSLDPQPPLLPTNFRTPIYPFWLFVIYLLFHSFKPAIFLGAAFFAFSAPLTYLIGREVFEEKTAITAAVLFALEPWALFQSGFLVAEQVFFPLFLFSIYLFLQYLKSGKRSNLYLASGFLGITTLTRPLATFFIFVFLAFVLAFELKKSFKDSLRILGLTVFIFVLVLSPWLVRNKIVLDTWNISSISNVNLYVENYAMLEKYLGKMLPGEDINERGRILLGTKSYEEAKNVRNSEILAGVALAEIRANLPSYAIMHLKAVPLFLLRNSYSNIFFDLGISGSDIQSQVTSIILNQNPGDFLKFVRNLSLGSLILLLLAFFWPAVILAVFTGLRDWDFKSLATWFLLAWVLYFLVLAGNLRDISRYKLAIHAPLLLLATVGLFRFFKFFRHE